MKKTKYACGVETDELENDPWTVEAVCMEDAAKSFAEQDPDWAPGDGDSCDILVEEFGKPETRHQVKVTITITTFYRTSRPKPVTR